VNHQETTRHIHQAVLLLLALLLSLQLQQANCLRAGIVLYRALQQHTAFISNIVAASYVCGPLDADMLVPLT
jgi:hypothetical protein